MENPSAYTNAISIAVMGWAAVCGLQDLWRLKVSNVLTLGMWLVAGLALLSGQTLLGLSVVAGLLGFGLAAVLTLPGYALGKLGAADVKMLMGIGLAAGYIDMLMSFALGSLLAAAVMILMRYRVAVPAVMRLTAQAPLLHLTPRPGKSFPFAICLALGFMAWRIYHTL